MKFRTLFAIAICLSSNCLFADTPTDAPLLPDNQPVLQQNATSTKSRQKKKTATSRDCSTNPEAKSSPKTS
jgi:hypothetical protein